MTRCTALDEIKEDDDEKQDGKQDEKYSEQSEKTATDSYGIDMLPIGTLPPFRRTIIPTPQATTRDKESVDINFSDGTTKLHILVVDDSRLNRKMLIKSLKSDGKK